MNTFTRELWQSAKVLILALILSLGVSYAFAWTGPTASAPNNNTPAPVNVGGTFQSKSGDLWANSMGTNSGYCIGSSCITAWPSGGVTKIVAGSNISISPPSGTGEVTVSAVGFGKICLENENCSGTVKLCAGSAPDGSSVVVPGTGGLSNASFGSWSNPQCGSSGSGWHISPFSSCGTGSGNLIVRCSWVLVQ